MKKILILMLAAMLMMAGCGKKESPAPVVTKDKGEAQATPEPFTQPPILPDVTAEDVVKIGYNDNSVPPDEYARVYTDDREIEKILEMMGELVPVEKEPEETEAAPGNYCSYDVYLQNGEMVTVSRNGDVIRCNGVYYTGRLGRVPAIDEAELYLEPSSILPERLDDEEWIIRGEITVFDEENTMVVTRPVVKRMDQEKSKWVELTPEQEIAAETVSVKDAVLELDLRDYDEISPEEANYYPNADYKIIYRIIMPTGEERELFGEVTVYLFW